MINDNENKAENVKYIHRHDIKRPRKRQGHNTKY